MLSERKSNSEPSDEISYFVFYCSDDNEKQFKIIFDSGSLKKDDIWHLCKNCNSKPEFQNHRISTEKLNS